MDKATGEMTSTVIVIVGLAAVFTLLSTVVWPKIRDKIKSGTNNMSTELRQSYVYTYEDFNM